MPNFLKPMNDERGLRQRDYISGHSRSFSVIKISSPNPICLCGIGKNFTKYFLSQRDSEQMGHEVSSIGTYIRADVPYGRHTARIANTIPLLSNGKILLTKQSR